MIWLSARTTCRPSPTSSVICVLAWMTALHLARPTLLHTRSCVCDSDGLSSGDEAVRVISGVAAKRSVWSCTCVDVRDRHIIASQDRRWGCWWECVAGARHQRSAPRRTAGWRRWSYWRPLLLPWFDDRLITDHHVTMIGYGKHHIPNAHCVFLVAAGADTQFSD